MKLFLILFFSFSLHISYAFEQLTITGKIVSSANGEPLIGAKIVAFPSQSATYSDKAGQFSLVPQQADSLISVTYVGYVARSIQLPIANNGPVVISLVPDNTVLEEVQVSTGYQNIPKERATGSFNVIDGRVLNQQVGTTILDRLPAVANGLIMDNSTNNTGRLMIRGLSTINEPKEPLIVVDNFPYEGDINNINPNDVESISILKDAAAASIWGARAGNGVIVITTKKGSFDNHIHIEANINTSVGDKPDLFYLPEMSASDYISVEEMLYEQGHYDSRINGIAMSSLSPVIEMLIQRKNGELSDAAYQSSVAFLNQLDIRDDALEHLYNKSVNQQYYLGLRGGSKRLTWTASAGYDRNLGNLAARYERLNLRFRQSYQPISQLNLTGEIYYTNAGSQSGKPNINQIDGLHPYSQFFDSSGSPFNFSPIRTSYADTAGRGMLLPWNYYPLEDYKHSQNTSRTNDVVINTSVNFTPFHFASLELRYQYERQQTNGRFIRDEYSFYTRNLINRFTQIAENQVTHHIPLGDILDLSNNVMESHQFRGQFNVSHSWNDHDIHVITGGEIREANTVSDRFRTYGYNSDILTFGHVDYMTQYPDFVTGGLSYIPQSKGFDELTTRFVSAYANGSYAFKNRYMLSGSARRDASNLFGLNTNDKWNLLWSVGASWEISREPFYRLNSVPYLRLRSTYGFSGNIDPSMSALTTIRYVAVSPNTPGAPYARPDNYSNPDLRWETAGMFNIGLDFTSLGGKLRGSLEYYRKMGKDLFGVAQMDATAGIGNTIDKNVATMRAMGVDVGLTSINMDGPLFSWQTTFNLNYNRDEVLDYYLSNFTGNRFVSGTNVSGVKGRPVYALYSYQWAGLDPETGDPRGWLDGEASSEYTRLRGSETQLEDLRYHGPTLPVWFDSLGNRFAVGNLSIDVRLTYKMGHFFRRKSIDYSALFSSGRGHGDFSDRWRNPGDENTTNIPSMVYPNPTSFRDEFYLRSEVTAERGDYIRLNYINVAYDLHLPMVGELGVKSLTLYANCSNFGLVWRANNYKIDPEVNSTPNASIYAVGVRVNFN